MLNTENTMPNCPMLQAQIIKENKDIVNQTLAEAIAFVRSHAVKSIAGSNTNNSEVISLIHPITEHRELYYNTLNIQ